MLAVYVLSIFAYAETIAYVDSVNEKRGCEASAYQATRYGHSLDQNLKVCTSL